MRKCILLLDVEMLMPVKRKMMNSTKVDWKKTMSWVAVVVVSSIKN